MDQLGLDFTVAVVGTTKARICIGYEGHACEVNLDGAHPNRKRCEACAPKDKICTHGKQRQRCRDDDPKTGKPCGGSSICSHGRQRPRCREDDPKTGKPCGGSAICTHGIRRDHCKPCGGSSFCTHGKQRQRCRDDDPATGKPCGGSEICTHGKHRQTCHECSPAQAFLGSLRGAVKGMFTRLGIIKDALTLEILGGSSDEIRAHIVSQFEPGMTLENYGEWHLDHRKPVASVQGMDKDSEAVRRVGHYTNLQPMWASENLEKSAYYDEATFSHVWTEAGWVAKEATATTILDGQASQPNQGDLK